MKFGMLDYQIAYDAIKGRVCISSSDTHPAITHWFTRDQILELISIADDGRKAIYEAALKEFPKETNS